MKEATTFNNWQVLINDIVSSIDRLDYSLQHGSTQKCPEMAGYIRCIDMEAMYSCLYNLKQVSGFIQTCMTNKEKQDLQWRVRYYLGDGKKDSEIIELLSKLGFEKALIKKYIKAFK